MGTGTTPRWAGLDVEGFRAAATSWLAEAAADAPSDYGAIVPEAEIAEAVAWQRRLADAGFAGLHWPVRWGGQGLTPTHTAAWLEECARAAVPPFLNMVGLVLTAEAVLAYGTDEQKAAHLPPLRTGDRVWCQLFSEPEAGSDLAHLRTVARRSGSGWVLDGEKIWTSNGHLAHWGICLARTDAEAPAHGGLSFFLVDMCTPGIEVRPVRQMTGAAEFDQVILDHVELPPEALLGDEGAGWSVAMSTLTHERNHIGALAIRLGLRLDRMVAALAPDPVLTPPDRVLRDRAVRLWGRGRAPAAELMAAPGEGIAGGTTQIQKTIVGERLLRLPREPGSRTV
jgi:alkylation response protein AidB-like acyl-CoA dehydrogenase